MHDRYFKGLYNVAHLLHSRVYLYIHISCRYYFFSAIPRSRDATSKGRVANSGVPPSGNTSQHIVGCHKMEELTEEIRKLRGVKPPTLKVRGSKIHKLFDSTTRVREGKVAIEIDAS